MKVSRRGSLGIAMAACLAGCGGGPRHDSGSASGPALQALPRDTFAAHVSGAGAGLRGAQDRLQVELAPGTGTGARPLTVTLTRSSCRGHGRCLLLAGRLAGTITAEPGVLDRGRTFAIAASGVVKQLAHVSATGTVTGVGNARVGRESLRLTLTSAAGSVVLSGQTVELPAFTSP
jgi:hypothetical protein